MRIIGTLIVEKKSDNDCQPKNLTMIVNIKGDNDCQHNEKLSIIVSHRLNMR
jgi:hypothetical protein